MKILYSESFKKDFLSLSTKMQKMAEKKLSLFSDDFRHPSLQTKKMEGLVNIWEGRVTRGYRFTFVIENKVCILRRIGTHDILKREK